MRRGKPATAALSRCRTSASRRLPACWFPHDTYLPRGIGLPGLAWQRGESVFLEDLAAAPGRFLRAEMAADAGLLRGLALPVRSRLDAVMWRTFSPVRSCRWRSASSAGLPMTAAHRWKRDYPFSELHGWRSSAAAALLVATADSASSSSIARAWHPGAPVISEHPTAEEGAPAAAAVAIGATALLAIPVVCEGAVVEVVALYL